MLNISLFYYRNALSHELLFLFKAVALVFVFSRDVFRDMSSRVKDPMYPYLISISFNRFRLLFLMSVCL